MVYKDQPGVVNSFNQTTVNVNLGVNFKVNRHFALSAGYQFTDVLAPNNVTYEYTQSIPFVGANLSF